MEDNKPFELHVLESYITKVDAQYIKIDKIIS